MIVFSVSLILCLPWNFKTPDQDTQTEEREKKKTMARKKRSLQQLLNEIPGKLKVSKM